MRVTESIDVDNIWRALGPWGRYQWKQISCYVLGCSIWAIHLLSIVFIGYRPKYQCRPSPNDSLANATDVWYEYGQCTVKVYRNRSNGVEVSEETCNNGWTYDIPREQSFVTEWDLLCGNEELAELTQALMTVGMAVGAFVFPSLSDRFGRKIVMNLSMTGLFVITVGTSFCNSYTLFIVLRILTGALQQGGIAGTSLTLETFPTETRCYTETIAMTFWTSAVCVMSPIAYLLRNYSWRYIQLTYAMLGVWAFFQWWILDESLRWLITNGKLDQARKVIRNACKWNKKDYSMVMRAGGFPEKNTLKEMDPQTSGENDDINHVSNEISIRTTDIYKTKLNPEDTELLNEARNKEDTIHSLHDERKAEKYTAVDICRYPLILRVSLILWFAWLTDSLTYNGLYMISSDLYGDRYVNFFLSALCEYPAIAFELYAFPRLGRPFSCMLCHGCAATGLILATVFITVGGNATMMVAATAFTLMGKMGITAAFSTLYLLTPESYPTNLRSIGLGVAAIVGKLGTMISPFSRNLAARALWAPGAIAAVCCVVVVISIRAVPETNGVELPQTIEELSMHYKNKKWTIQINNSDGITRQTNERLLNSDQQRETNPGEYVVNK